VLALAASVPLVTIWHVRVTRKPLLRAVGAVALRALLALVLVLIAWNIWYIGHGCYD
jgi:hypothetical protein